MINYFYKNAKYIRKEKKISQEDMAKKTGIDRSTISRIENGEIETSIDNAIKISNALDIPLQKLISIDLSLKNIETKNISNFFPKNLKYLREKKGLEQQELAELLNVGRSTISCWENGIRSPQMEYVLKLAQYFKINDEFIFKDLSSEENQTNDKKNSPKKKNKKTKHHSMSSK